VLELFLIGVGLGVSLEVRLWSRVRRSAERASQFPARSQHFHGIARSTSPGSPHEEKLNQTANDGEPSSEGCSRSPVRIEPDPSRKKTSRVPGHCLPLSQ
jgi:hypothetical protein